jgi:glutamine synthetase
MFGFDRAGNPVWEFKGKHILQGETDGSSYPNGGLRATHRAGGYLAVDPTSPIFLRGDTIFIPSCLVSYYGHALDEKTPLLRASDALSREGVRLLKLCSEYDLVKISEQVQSYAEPLNARYTQ